MNRPRFLHLLSRAARATQVVADEGLSDLGLTAAQAGALFVLQPARGGGVNSVADALGLAQSAVSVLIQRLEQAGLVERQTDPNDRRAVLITLTSRGKALRARAIERAHTMNTAATRGFNAAEQAVIARWLQHMIDLKEEGRE